MKSFLFCLTSVARQHLNEKQEILGQKIVTLKTLIVVMFNVTCTRARQGHLIIRVCRI